MLDIFEFNSNNKLIGVIDAEFYDFDGVNNLNKTYLEKFNNLH